jgi:diketogulonate reductase-like aldo/keto reductase
MKLGDALEHRGEDVAAIDLYRQELQADNLAEPLYLLTARADRSPKPGRGSASPIVCACRRPSSVRLRCVPQSSRRMPGGSPTPRSGDGVAHEHDAAAAFEQFPDVIGGPDARRDEHQQEGEQAASNDCRHGQAEILWARDSCAARECLHLASTPSRSKIDAVTSRTPANPWNRRRALSALAAAATCAALRPSAARGQPRAILTRPIPSTGETLPVIGLGSWITFNVGNDPVARDTCTDVMRTFVEAGGRMIDSSPMYGSSQEVIGEGLRKAALAARIFSADKVWISAGARGREQIEQSRRHWQVPRFDLVQVHNLLNWQEHLPTLFAMKAAGQVRYVGITTSEGRRHREIEQLMRSQPIDFVQLTYNPLDRDVEERILPLAGDRGISVIVNRPFREGALLRALARRPLPTWAAELDCTSWAQLVLKFIVSHPAVTCAIPATTSVAHGRENMNAAYGRLPDPSLRQRIIADVERA